MQCTYSDNKLVADTSKLKAVSIIEHLHNITMFFLEFSKRGLLVRNLGKDGLLQSSDGSSSCGDALDRRSLTRETMGEI